MKPTPPRWAERILEAVLAPAERSAVLGDLHEEFQARAALSYADACRWYRRQVRRSLVSSLLRRLAPAPVIAQERHPMTSILQDFRLGLRMFARRPLVSAVAVLSLAIGIGLSTGVFGLIEAAVLRPLPIVARTGAAVAIGAAALLEYWVVPLRLWPYPDRPPLYSFLARQPDGIVAEFPAPRMDLLPGHDPRYIYMSIFHWKRLVNGYSGYYPPSYIVRMERLASFPDTGAIAQLRADGVRYLIVHEGSYIRQGESARILAALDGEGLKPVTRLYDGWAAATLFELGSP